MLEDHEKSLQEERSADPERFAINQSIAGRATQMAPKSVTDVTEESVPQVRVKEINVKQLDRNVTHLRASKQQQMQGWAPSSGSVNGQDGPYSNESSPKRPTSPMMEYGVVSPDKMTSPGMGGGGMLAENSVSILNNCISRIIGPHNVDTWNNAKDGIQNLLSLLPNVQQPNSHMDNMIARTLNEIRGSAVMIADASVVTPKQFWNVADIFCAAFISANYNSATFIAATDGFASIGRRIVQRDSRSSIILFSDFALVKLTSVLTNNPSKRLGILRVLYAFSPNEISSHIQCIKRLQSLIPDLKVFIHCLTVLASYETAMDDAMLDLYLYYANIAIAFPSPKIRAGAMSVLALLLPQSSDIAMFNNMFLELVKICKQEAWWEFHAHMLTLCNAIFIKYGPDCVDNFGNNNAVESLIRSAADVIQLIFHTKASRNIQLWGLVTLASCTASVNVNTVEGSVLIQAYVSVLLNLNKEDRQLLLNDSQDSKNIPLPSSTGLPFILYPITRANGLAIITYVTKTILNNKLERFQPEFVDVLQFCIQATILHTNLNTNSNSSSKSNLSQVVPSISNILDNNGWLDSYNQLKEYYIIGISDVDIAVSCTSIIYNYIAHCPLHATILQEAKFIGLMRLLYPADNSGSSDIIYCQTIFEDFLRKLVKLSSVPKSNSTYEVAVTQLLHLFATHHSQQFLRGNLPKLLKEFTA